MVIQLGQRSDHGFDEPLGLLTDCHRRVERFLATLAAIARERRGGPLHEADRRELESALGYFETAGPRHTADEEESLFPRLRAAASPAVRAASDALDRLEADHRKAERHHAEGGRLGRQWLLDGALSPADASSLREHLDALERLYRDHIAVEEHEVFPAAGRALSPSDLEAVGREMAARRGVAYAPSGPRRG